MRIYTLPLYACMCVCVRVCVCVCARARVWLCVWMAYTAAKRPYTALIHHTALIHRVSM